MMKRIPLNKLTISPENVRTVSAKKQSDKQLIASIAEEGLLNNLVVIEAEGDLWEVIAGGRRLAALEWLAANGDIAADALFDCNVRTRESAVAVSLAENFAREPMHPADEFVAYKKLEDQGKSVPEIAKAFGVSKASVKKLLRLGQVHPQLVELYRKEKLDLDDIMAFSVTVDQERQWACYEALKNRHISAYYIRQFLTDDTVTADDPYARFVGLKAYRAAGGRTEDDLFRSTVYWLDVALLRQMGNEKLESVKEECGKEGWLWVEICEDVHRRRHQCRELSAPFANVPEDLLARIEAAEKEFKALEEKDINDFTDGDFDRQDELGECLETMEEEKAQYRAFTVEQKAISGCVIGLSMSGELVIFKGLVRAEDEAKVKAVQPGEGLGQSPDGEDEAFNQPESVESEALRNDLRAYYRQAFQAHLLAQDDLCQDMLTFALASGVFGVWECGGRLLDIGVSCPDEKALGIDATPAAALIQEKRDGLDLAWLELDTQAARFDGFLGLTKAAKKRLLTFCIARLAYSPLKASEESALPMMAEASGFDIQQLWQPTEENYFGRLRRDGLLAIGSEVMGEEWREASTKLKKRDLVPELANREAMADWLPEFMR